MKKYFVSCVCFLALVNFIFLSCATDSDPVSNATSAPSIQTTPATMVNLTTATCGGNLLSSGGGTILGRGVCYATTPNPTIADSKVPNPGTIGTFVCSLTGLTGETQYYVRAYATNIAGTTYGQQITFTTTSAVVAPPVVTTTAASDITDTTANSGGNVTSAGGAAITGRGICWSTTENPTILNNVVNATGTLGVFTSSLIGLAPNTVYYVKAFATNSGAVGYGAQISFNTTGTSSVGLPTVTTTDATSITQTSALSGGNVLTEGDTPIISRGICWATTENPTVLNNTIPVSGTTGSFGSTLSGLTANTVYYIRAYATNSTGTAYGAQVMFTTSGGTTTGPTGGNAICDGSQPTTVVTVTSSTGKIWMDRNLGASRAATSKTDFNAYGCLYQWGRGNDGHASITWSRGEEGPFGELAGVAVNGTTTTLATSNSPGNALFITDQVSIPYDWRNPHNSDLWQGVNGVNNPCPSGYRVPTKAEFQAEISAYTIGGSNSAFNSIHKFPVAGDRAFDSGSVRDQGIDSFFWTSTPDDDDSFNVYIAAGEVYSNVSNGRAGGYSVRCIKN